MKKTIAIFAGMPQEICSEGTEAWWDKPWHTASYKAPVKERVWVRYQGIEGDGQADRRVHGGADKALCVYPSEHYSFWQTTLGLPDFSLGAFGENLALSGLTEADACVGDVYALGETLVEVSQPRQPCWKLARRWRIKDLPLQVDRSGFTGFYFRVLRHGHIGEGDSLTLEQRPFPQWSITRCNDVMSREEGGSEAAEALSECPALAASWRDELFARARKSAPAASAARVQSRLSGPQ